MDDLFQPPPDPRKSPRSLAEIFKDLPAIRTEVAGAGYDGPAEFPAPPPVEDGPDLITAREQVELHGLLAEAASRRREAIKLYRPTPEQAGFHDSRAPIRLPRGGNRGGKTLCAAAEVARAVTAQDPHDKFPKRGRAIFVGKDLIHCSKVMYRKLFKPGAFKIIKDLESNEWRSFHPDLDAERAREARDAPPLIPRRFYNYKAISWENKKEEIAKTVTISQGDVHWECTFFSGEGDPPQGWDVDLIWFDEEIPHAKWLHEMLPRLVDRGGRLIWSATPQAGTVQLYELSARAEDEKDEPNPSVTEHFMNITMNPFISQENKDRFRRDVEGDDEEYRVRYLGDFAIHGMRVYPEFSPKIHGAEAFSIGDDWARYVAIDPGRQVAAALFVAVAPPGSPYAGRGIVYDEVYLKKSNAILLAQTMKRHVGLDYIQGWLIDHHEGRKTEAGVGLSIEEQYATAFRGAGLEANGFRGFIWASDDVDAGILAARQTMQLRNGTSQLLFFHERLRWFAWEMERYVYQKIAKTGIVTDRPLKRNDHLMDCFRYLSLHQLKYVKPPRRKTRTSYVVEYLAAKKKRLAAAARAERGYGDSVVLG